MRAVVQHYWDLIRGAKKWLTITVAIFLFALAATIIVGLVKPSLIEEAMNKLPGGNETGFADFLDIATHNVKSMLLIWCGCFVLAITPVVDTLGMGFICGGMLVNGPFLFGFLAMIPHGILELPATLLSNAFFLRLGVRWAFQRGATARKRAFVSDLQDSLKIALLCAVLFCVAASLEAFVTPKVLDFYIKNHFVGVGVEFATKDGQLTIERVIPGRPAAKAGLSAGQFVRKIDGSPTTGKTVNECAEMVHGMPGTQVTLEVIDLAHLKTNTVELVRELKQ